MNISKFSFVCNFISPTELPSYKGFALRGAFGSSFKKVCCSYPAKDCDMCIVREKCVYFKIFEPTQDFNTKGKDIPRGFVLEPPYSNRKRYKAGDRIVFNVILFGWVREYLPFFILAFERMGCVANLF